MKFPAVFFAFFLAVPTVTLAQAQQFPETSQVNTQNGLDQKAADEKREEEELQEKQEISKSPNGDIKAADLKQVEAFRLKRYKPVYFAYGNPLTKAQFSFKSLVYEEIPFYIGYSQIIFWELAKESKPFLDATYNPEIFYSYSLKSSSLRSIDFGIWEHNSNGKDGLSSRSYNQASLRLNTAFEGKKWITEFSAKFRYLYGRDYTNLDINDYISPMEFELKVLNVLESMLDHTEIDIHFHPGGKYGNNWDKGGYQIGVQFHIGGVKVVPAFYMQYYSGYGETLINYDERVTQFRAGIVF